MNYKDVENTLSVLATDDRAEAAAWYFKTGPGEYGEGDQFIGVTVPNQRKVAREFRELDLKEAQKLLDSPIHEHRLTAIFIMYIQYKKAKEEEQREKIYLMYLKNVEKGNVNNWDLVDSSASYIAGDFLLDKPRDILYQLAKDGHLWQQRVAIIATAKFIDNDQFDDTFSIAEILLHHDHDLIQKAVGWMLREVGKRDVVAEQEFLDAHYKDMPRTMLRYAIEKFSKETRQEYLKGTR